MTNDRSLERAARSWLEEGPTRAPDRPVDAALARIQTTSQERDLRIPWRYPHMNSSLRIAAGVAAVAVVALFAINLLPAAPGPGTPTQIPSPSPSAAPGALSKGPLGAGTYATAFPVSLQITLPAGWEGLVVSPTVTVLQKGDAFLGFWIVDKGNRDPCDQGAGVDGSGVGPTVADLASALTDVKGFYTTPAVGVTVDGIDGQYVELLGPTSACPAPEPVLWRTPDNSCRCMDGNMVERNRIWILDVNGTRLAVNALEIPASEGITGTSAAVLGEIQAMVDSLQLER